ncbi:putative uncharacterized protein DDB_G0289963 [Cotesia glomerata]|uniref:putative uncharacterized protein DDB_G0289963 n=1 Tax=Cotesia glomerata TaxID=32391 RepID=UPI001D010929|nr:putative uncharacterized protein DDB_G0289963 [Cotesia glomerata]
MANAKPVHQPIRLSEYINASNKSSDKKQHKPRMEPVRIKDLLLSASKARSASVDRQSRRTKLFAVPKHTVRRALYGKSPSPSKSTSSQSSVETKSSVSVSKPNTPSFKRNRSLAPKTKARQSMLPQPNFIVKKNKQKVLDNCPPTVVEERLSEVMKISPQPYQRPTVIKSVSKKCSSVINNQQIDNCEAVHVEYGTFNNIANRTIDLEASIVDKENIPPDNLEPLTTDGANLDLFQNSRLEKIENDLQTFKEDLKIVKEQQSLLIDLVQKIFTALTVKNNEFQSQVSEPLNNCCVSSSPLSQLISASPDDKENSNNSNNNNDNDNISNNLIFNKSKSDRSKKKQRRSSTSMEERRRSARIASKLTPRKNDSFVSLENELNIVHSTTKSFSAPITPKNDNRIIKSKSARPLREYMAMKASMTFLETPDASGFRRAINYGDDTPARNKSLRRTISTKILNELEDLYNDSEEAEENY